MEKKNRHVDVTGPLPFAANSSFLFFFFIFYTRVFQRISFVRIKMELMLVLIERVMFTCL